jgi:hypothetical protein
MLAEFFNKEWRTRALLFAFSVGVFFFYFHHTFLNLNSMLTSTEGDGMKNYYTFIYHTVKDHSLIEFSGLNYPYGEHCVYTDCQPLLTFLFKLLPFTHGYLVGILHFLMLFSFIITPNILYNIFRLYKLNIFTSFLSSLSITLIIPQMDRIGGHFGLSYGCVIPLAIYLMTKYVMGPNTKIALQLFVFNCCLFLLHPYLGLGTSIFAFITLFLYGFKTREIRTLLKQLLPSMYFGIGPIVFFMLFMKLTDTHTGRPPEPSGMELGVANIQSVFVPTFGPFQGFLQKYLSDGPREWEGLSYIGIFPLFMLVLCVLALSFCIKKIEFNRITIVLLLAATLLLLFSFGIHNKILEKNNITIAALKQFRTLGRFAWFFYFMAPIFSTILLHRIIRYSLNGKTQKILLIFMPFLFFSFNLTEGHYFIKERSANYLKSPNVFLEKHLSENEKELIKELSKINYSAVLPIPYYCTGSEIYDRDGKESAYLSMLLSYHCTKPIFGGLLARTSIEETKNVIDLFNEYKTTHEVSSLLKDQNILILKTAPEKLPNETRLLKRLKPYKRISETTLYLATINNFSVDISKETTQLSFQLNSKRQIVDSAGIYFVRTDNKKPFVVSNINDYEKPFVIPKHKYKSGNYTISFHFHYEKETSAGFDMNFILAKVLENSEDWQVIRPMRHVSGYYNGYAIFEKNVTLDSTSVYNILLQGSSKKSYHISHFMLRPSEQDIKYKDENGKVFLNNYPVKE